MESTASKPEVLKPVILKAGVPLAVTLAGFIYSWIMAKKSLSSNKPSTVSTNEVEESSHSLTSMEEDQGHTHAAPLEQEISGLRSQIEAMQMRELALRLRFDQYCDLREQECVLGEFKNTLAMETARVEFLDREISSMEAENWRLENFVVQYLNVVEKIECWKAENRVLQRKFWRLMRRSMAQSRLAKEQALKIEAGKAEILRSQDALQTRTNVIDKSEDEIRELQRALDQLQDEKNELLKKLDTAEKSYASKNVAGDVTSEEYNQVVNELEQAKKERADEVKELIYLRWTNACLRHELTRHNEQQNQDRDHIEPEPGGSDEVINYDSEHDELHEDDSLLENHHNVPPPLDAVHHRHGDGSKRKKLLKRLKRWVEGSEKA